MSDIELTNQVLDLINNVKDIYLFCREHYPNFIALGTMSSAIKVDKKKIRKKIKKYFKKRKKKRAG